MTLYAVFVGIDDYDDPTIDPLRGAVRDSKALFELFSSTLGLGNDAKWLGGRRIAVDEVWQTLDQLRQRVNPGDQFLLYFAGHGFQIHDDQLLLLSAVKYSDLRAGRVSSAEALSLKLLRHTIEQWSSGKIPALFVLDTCRASLPGQTAYSWTPSEPGWYGEADNLVARGPGRLKSRQAVLNACSDSEVAYEPGDGSAGLLCHALEAEILAQLRQGRELTINAATVQSVLTRIVGRLKGPSPQTPRLWPEDTEFAFASLRAVPGHETGAVDVAGVDERDPGRPVWHEQPPMATSHTADFFLPNTMVVELPGRHSGRFRVMEDPVTWGQWRKLCLRAPRSWKDGFEPWMRDNVPVTGLSIDEVEELLRQLNRSVSGSRRFSGPMFRLMTPREWVHARGDPPPRRLTTRDAVFRWHLNNRNRFENLTYPAPVDHPSNLRNRSGLRGMLGNVRELVTDPTARGEQRAMGGGFRSEPDELVVDTARRVASQGDDDVGLRFAFE